MRAIRLTSNKFIVIALLVSHFVAGLAGYILGRGVSLREYAGAERTTWGFAEADTLDLGDLVLTMPAAAEVYRDTVRVEQACIEVPSSLIEQPATAEQQPTNRDTSRSPAFPGLAHDVGTAAWGTPPISPARIPQRTQAQTLASSYRFLLLPLTDDARPAVQVGYDETAVHTYLPRGGRAITYRYPHPEPSWTLSAGLRSGLYADRFGAWALGTVRYKSVAIGAGYGGLWTPLEEPHMGPIVTLSARLFSFHL